jgi:arginine decarboxylase
VLNGFKDEEFIELAFAAPKVGKKVVIVIEKLNELDHVLNVVERHEGALPMLGHAREALLERLRSLGKVRWRGREVWLTTTELLEVIRRLEEADRMDMLKLLHFHIGSQLTDIKRIKNAMKEAARVYAKVYQMKVPIELLDVGGGMAVDYDGSKTAFDSSAKLHRAGVCQRRYLHHQTGVRRRERSASDDHQESGRFLAAYHAILVTTFSTRSKPVVEDITPIEIGEDDPQVVIELGDLRESITVKNYREYYHDALEHREELFTLFNLGLISLEDRAKGEVLFWDVCERATSTRNRRSMCQKSLANCAGCSARST